ncbi:hypothetical protein [Singulisphaera acidiphila]|uniref:hypothetical protein n=1 Tax=Singulisphaera acidiphila TaxID=466153 RepID=UPI0002470CA6|nr:hypothetical protein [Singulisphaera acidiphila]
MYGEHRIDLAKRAGQRRGWSTGVFDLYGEKAVKRYKTFLATWRPTGGAIRVVLVDEATGWRAFFCTDVSASVADILGAVAACFSLEEVVSKVKGSLQLAAAWTKDAVYAAFGSALHDVPLEDIAGWFQDRAAYAMQQ